MTRNLKLVALALLITVLAAACGGNKTTPAATDKTTPAVQGSSTKAASASPTQAPAAPTPAGPQATGDEGEELSVSDRQAGLENLDSYRATWKLDWKSSGGDTSEDVSWQWIQEHTKEPKAAHWRWSGLDKSNDETQGTMEFWQIGETTYIVMAGADGEQSCMTSTSDDNQPDNSLMGPQTLGSVNGARLVGTETMNGIKARHYRYDEKSMALFGGGRVSGDIWVAVDGGFVVKDAATWEGRLFGMSSDDKATGSGSWTWELTEVNAPLAILAPEGCKSAAGDIPILPDATDKASFGDTVTYKTATKMADVLKFYQDEMRKAGWEPEGEATTTDQFASLAFKKDNQTANLMVSVDGDATSVVISVQKTE